MFPALSSPVYFRFALKVTGKLLCAAQKSKVGAPTVVFEQE